MENDPCFNKYTKTYAIGKDLLPNEKIEFKSDSCCVAYVKCDVVGKIKGSSFSHKFHISTFGKGFGCFKVVELHLR